MWAFAPAVFLLAIAANAEKAGDEELSDKRCKCVCPRVNGTSRAVYTNKDVTPDLCNCDHVVLPALLLEGYHGYDASEFCARCQCKHESRNSATIKAVVIAFLVVTGILMVYMVYLVAEAKFFKSGKSLSEDSDMAYEQQIDEEYTSSRGTAEVEHRQPSHGASIRSRLKHQMTKWKKAVMQQRGNVYVRRTVLNN
ncbi:hypothetical protein RvY_09305 [Ramazzottius varieornatus]|uniref:Uncharacterized protein n=1 Tax=Ramazzottius varieornatus TaxID=947166 RepID=A0A1D1VDH4_RAMVA|nr:hypothetical protein RvY_09305 [Ramazzottius varieornatus]